MRIAILSDVHTDQHRDRNKGAPFWFEQARRRDVDVFVVAGDLANGPSIIRALRTMADTLAPRPVIYVPGNHDYWGYTREALNEGFQIIERAVPTLTVLAGDKREVVIDGQRFVGGTLWYENLQADPFIDYRYILDVSPTQAWMHDDHRNLVRYLQEQLTSQDVVITHHMPSYRLIHPRFAGYPTNHFFANHLDSLIEERQPRLWIYGHTHTFGDAVIGRTRCVSNPRGYLGEDTNFNPTFLVDLSLPIATTTSTVAPVPE